MIRCFDRGENGGLFRMYKMLYIVIDCFTEGSIDLTAFFEKIVLPPTGVM